MSDDTKRVGGRHRPPNERLIGRTAAGQIIGCGKGGVRRYERDGLLAPDLIEPNGVRWFDIDKVKKLAEAIKRFARKARGRRKGPSRGGGPNGYHPELGSRRLAPPDPAPAPPRPPARSGPASAAQGIGPKTKIRPEWWDGDLSPREPAPKPATGSGDESDRAPDDEPAAPPSKRKA